MKPLLLSLVAGAGIIAASPSAASVATYGGSFASACYTAAEARSTSPDSLSLCDSALALQALNEHDTMATHVNRGIILMLRGQHGDALADFDRAIAINPRHPEAWLNKGVITFDTGNSRAASELAVRALELGTRKPAIAYYIRGVAQEDAGNVKAAYSDLVRATELAPTWSLPKRELRRYRVVQR